MKYLTILRIVAILACLAAPVRIAVAQLGKPLVQISGLVRDSASGRAPARTQVCAFADTGTLRPYPRCGRVDSIGVYHIDSVESGPRLLAVHCALAKAPISHQLAYEHIVVGQGDLRRDWIVRGEPCDARPIRQITTIFSGHYAAAFEMSAFVPCPSDSWLVPDDGLGADPRNGRAWARWGNSVSAYKWPTVPADSFGIHSYFVRWRGTLVGPGHYGHMGMSPFQISVDSVLEVRAATKADCR